MSKIAKGSNLTQTDCGQPPEELDAFAHYISEEVRACDAVRTAIETCDRFVFEYDTFNENVLVFRVRGVDQLFA